MRGRPIFATIVAAAAVLTMIMLGIWQLERKGEKEALLARYENAADLAPVLYPAIPNADDLPLFRQSTVQCTKVTGWRSIAGTSAAAEAGFAHLASCTTTDGASAIIAAGWSKRPEAPSWKGGKVTGLIAPHKPELIKLVVTDKLDGLEKLTVPSRDAIPNNHLLYAIQWFIFAFAAALIFVLALRKRQAS